MKTTSVSYCQISHQEFKNNEVVYYIVIDNNIVCGQCAEKANTNEVQPRIYEKQ
jgi:hypothetical protein